MTEEAESELNWLDVAVPGGNVWTSSPPECFNVVATTVLRRAWADGGTRAGIDEPEHEAAPASTSNEGLCGDLGVSVGEAALSAAASLLADRPAS